MNQFIIVQYRKSKVKTGKPIAIKVGRKEIFTDNLTLKNISANVIFNPKSKSRHGTTTPMIIKLDVEPQIETDLNILEAKRIKERIRYQKKHPIVKGIRIPIPA